jgi:thiol-disulfide isomerase/thioredoxin
MIYWEKCGYCKMAAPHFVNMKQSIEIINKKRISRGDSLPEIQLFAMNYEMELNKPFLEAFKVATVPQFVMFSSCGNSGLYSGERTADAFIASLLEFEEQCVKPMGLSYQSKIAFTGRF